MCQIGNNHFVHHEDSSVPPGGRSRVLIHAGKEAVPKAATPKKIVRQTGIRDLNQRTRQRPALEMIAVYCQQRFCWLSLTEFAVLLLGLREEAGAGSCPK